MDRGKREIAEFAGLEFAGLENDGLENDGVEQEETYILHTLLQIPVTRKRDQKQ